MNWTKEDIISDMNEGELQLFEICSSLETSKFKVIPNALYDRMNSGTNQIDLISVTNKGIFVFEMKDYKGWIFGDENHVEWTQSIRITDKKTKKYKFRNPVKQNDNHIKTVKQLLVERGYNLPVYNVVVFGEKAEIKSIDSSIDVVSIKEIDKIFDKYHEIFISDELILEIYDYLTEKNIIDDIKRREHINYAKSFGESNKKESNSLENEIHYLKKKEIQYLNNKEIPYPNNRKNNDKDENRIFTTDYNKGIVALVAVLTFLGIIFMKPNINTSMFLVLTLICVVNIKTKKLVPWLIICITLFSIVIYAGEIYFRPNLEFLTPDNNEQLLVSNIKTKNTNDSPIVIKDKAETSSNEIEKQLLPTEDIVTDISKGESEIIEKNSSNEEIVVNPVNDEVSDSEPVQEQVSKIVVEENIIEEPIQVASFFLGSTKEEVKKILGEPTSIKGTILSTWNYRYATITFNEFNKVIGWQESDQKLAKGMLNANTSAKTIFLDSTKEDVLDRLGTPTYINHNQPNVWKYGRARLIFNVFDKVKGWDDDKQRLVAGMPKIDVNEEAIFLESTKTEVLSKLGPPSKISSVQPYVWYYGLAKIYFNEFDKVSGWDEYGQKLAVGMPEIVTDAEQIFLESTKAEVLSKLGPPSKISSVQPYVWYYGLAKIYFNEFDKVSGWDEYGQNLAVGMPEIDTDAEQIFLESTKAEVLSKLGPPSKISPAQPYVWNYGLAKIYFDEFEKISGWDEYGETLKIAMPRRVEYPNSIFLDSMKEDVLNALGSPTKINTNNSSIWYYNNAEIYFGSDNKIKGWKDYGTILNTVLPKKVEDAEPFKVGSSFEEVLNVMGGPTGIAQNSNYIWNYGLAKVTFNEYNKVTEWKNYNNILKVNE